MKAMRKGDRCFFYHSVNEKQIVGVVEVAKAYYPDHTDASGRFGMVDVKPVKPFKKPVTLDEIKAEPLLADMGLILQSPLSVMPGTDEQWMIISAMGATKAHSNEDRGGKE